MFVCKFPISSHFYWLASLVCSLDHHFLQVEPVEPVESPMLLLGIDHLPSLGERGRGGGGLRRAAGAALGGAPQAVRNYPKLEMWHWKALP